MENTALHIESPMTGECAEMTDILKESAHTYRHIREYDGALPSFRPITAQALDEIWPILEKEPGRTTDFSYGGILMWVDYFKYSYAVVNDTVFIKGLVEDDLGTPAFALPVGKMALEESLGVIKSYCKYYNLPFELSAVPEYAIRELESFRPKAVEELTDWGDYLYNAEMLATLKGKKMSKKRNHVNKFNLTYPDNRFEPMTLKNYRDALLFMDNFDKEGDSNPMAITERRLSRDLICKAADSRRLIGGILYVGDETAGYTIGDIKNDTLYVHVEKCTRKFMGSYEKINQEFASHITTLHPQIKYINREDDSGDEGLRKAKRSYHPLDILRKYNVIL